MAIAVGGDRVDREVAGVRDGGEFEAGESTAHSLWVGLGTQACEKQAKQRQESHLEIMWALCMPLSKYIRGAGVLTARRQ